EKEQAAANFKGGFGFHPLGAWCDNSGEMLAVHLRPGNSNANHAGDQISVLTEAIGQVPAPFRRRLLVRADTAGATHQLLDWLHEQGRVRGRSVEYSIGFPVHKGVAVHDAIHTVPESAWQGALDLSLL
ncbi:transposase, partial [Bradyrhizobium sp. NBAIM08]|uniref:transposase n=1 Tax=Bradyrhizobium sp. NBAIM08 TaxID=2793815 RepID=UPI001CD48D10